jgi:TRAP-type C4-dicarboxylate transport system substrate-binding protein
MRELESAMSTYRKILKKMMEKALPESRSKILHNELRSIHATMSNNFRTTEKDTAEFIELAKEFVDIYG